ncbi:MAG TPA: hypothetical protein VG710_15365, partial [Opitutus sp.]|nr:hypothetical protein [Opitutus sp.]
MIASDDLFAGAPRPNAARAACPSIITQSTPSRPKVVARGRALAASGDYPSPTMLQELSDRILVSREWNEGQA